MCSINNFNNCASNNANESSDWIVIPAPIAPLAPIPSPDSFSLIESEIVEGVIWDETISRLILPVVIEPGCVRLIQGYLGNALLEWAYLHLKSMNLAGMDVEVQRRRDGLLEKWIENARPHASLEKMDMAIAQFSTTTLQRAYSNRICRMYAPCG